MAPRIDGHEFEQALGKISYEREMLTESHCNTTLLQALYSAYIQAYKAEIPTVVDTLEIWLL